MKCECEGAFPEKKYTKWFDCDIIKNTVEIRHRMPGDYIVINKEGKTQKLKQYFINEKIPQEQRDKVWLAADGQEIMWIIGYRQSQAYQVTDKTMRIMEIDICKGGK
jgi:tRNA(Ile)-lysidine synthase